MRHQTMTVATKESDLAQEVFGPIPPHTLRPGHEVVVVSLESAKMKFEEMRRAASLAAAAESLDKFRAQP